MADTKKYKIIIEGINESIEGVGTLQDSLDKLGKKVEESGKTMKTASSSMDELAKTNQKIKEYNEEYATALAANKAVLADHNKEVKNKLDLEKAELTVQADLRDTYAQKQQLLTAMGKVIKNTAGDTSELQAKYAELNQELKDFDASLGNHQRNVGDYGQATKNLKQELREMQEEMADMIANGIDKADPKFVALAQKAGQLKDAMGDARQEVDRFASDTKKLDDVINIAQSATAAFTLYKGAMSAFGIETEGAVEAIQKLQGAMAILQSLKQLQDSLEQNSATAKIFSKTMSLMGLSMDGATKASKLLRIGLASIGIGLIIGLVMTLIEYWDDIKKSFTDTFPILKTLSDKFNGLQGVIRGVGQAIVHWLTNPIITLAKVIKKVFAGDFAGAIEEAKNGIKKQFTGLKDAFFKGVEDSRKKVVEEADKTSKKVVSKVKETTNKVKELRDKMLDDWFNAERKTLDDIEKERKAAYEAEKKRLENLKKLRDKDKDAEYKYQKAQLENDLEYARTEEEKIKIKQKLLDLETKIAKENAIASAAETMGLSVDELQQRLDMTDEKWMGLNEEQKQVLQTLLTQLATIDTAADTARKKLSGSSTGGSGSGSGKKNEHTLTDSWHEFIYGGDGTPDELSSKAKELADAVGTAYQETIAPVFDGVMNLGDAIHQAMEFAIEEAENALEEAEELHDEAVDKVEESKDRISDINDKMKESSGAQLEQYKQQMADEVLLLQQREQEEKRLQKEKEKREKELEKQKKKQRKLELQQQLIQAIVSGALAVVNGLATQPFMPVGIAMGALAGVATAIQIATITNQISKLADGGLLQGRSHAQGGIAVGNTGIEVEGGEYVVNKRSTAKYLPLLQQINEEGARKKTVANQLGKMADGGQLNYERINSNMDALNTAKIVSAAIEGIEMHPVVSVVDINRGQKNLTEVRQLAGAKS